MAQNIVEIARGLKDKTVQGVIMQLARESMVFQKISFEGTDSLLQKMWEQDTITEFDFRRLNSGYSEVKDSLREVVEGVAFLGGFVDIDRAYTLVQKGEVDEYAKNLMTSAERFRYKFMDTFINGDLNVDPDSFNGLKRRVSDLVAIGHTDALVAGASSNAGLELSASDANRHAFFDKWEEAQFNLRDGVADCVITSKQGYLAITRAARRAGLLDITRDMFDREITTVGGIPVLYAGTKGDQSTEIITSSEDPGDGGNDATSYYFVRFGERFINGIQLHSPERIYDQVITDGVTRRVVWEWPVGLHLWDRRSVVRLSKVVPTF